jgi:hypothetical protein
MGLPVKPEGDGQKHFHLGLSLGWVPRRSLPEGARAARSLTRGAEDDRK